MEEIILKELKQLEEKHNITILFAIESGSRGWGFSSKDSDYDVRFVYKHKTDWYLNIEEQRDVVELPVDEVLDINGWDIRKALRLAAKSNFVIWEWLQSPIAYIEQGNIRQEMLNAIMDRFSPISTAHSYLSLAKRTMDDHYKEDTILLKKYFYIIRALLSCRWILEKKSVPPMVFSDVLEIVKKEKEFLIELNKLLKIKKDSTEKDLCKRVSEIDHVLDSTFSKINSEIANLPKATSVSMVDINFFFKKVISDND